MPPSPADSRRHVIDTAVKKEIGRGGPGAAIAVIEGGEVMREGYGFADLDANRKIDASTVFDLASMSKQFTAAIIMLLVEDGEVSLTASIHTYLEKRLWPHHEPISVADLLRMTSGLPNYTDDDDSGGTNDAVAKWAAERDWGPSGKEHDYCNTNYVLLAEIAKKVTGSKSFSALLTERIFSPLHMTGTVVLDRKGTKIPRRACGYSGKAAPKLVSGGKDDEGEDFQTGDGNVFSSIDDLVKWDAALRAGTLLMPESWTTMTTEHSRGTEGAYGFGFYVDKKRDLVHHPGEWAGTSTWMGRWGTGRAVIVLSNLDDVRRRVQGACRAETLGRAIGGAMWDR